MKTPDIKFDFDACSHQYGDYPWDHWEKVALKSGVSKDLASLGRQVMRECHQHSWTHSETIIADVSWQHEDAPRKMITEVLTEPERIKAYWTELLNTDGCRIDPDTGEPFDDLRR